MHRKTIRWVLTALAALPIIGFATSGRAAGEGEVVHYPLKKPPHISWSFAGPFGAYDQAQLQRGYKVYKEVCASCHSMEFVRFRNLADKGGPEFSVEAAKALAAGYIVQDGPDAEGNMFERPAELKDAFPNPFPNVEAARAANGGAYPPDLSLIAKARAVERGFPDFLFDIVTTYQEQGPDYLHALLTGYQDPPAGVEIAEGQYYNPYFIAGPSLAMPPPLTDGQVAYDDGAPQTVDQYAQDVSAFLMWAAEPHLEARKETGFKVIAFLLVFAVLLYFLKRRTWDKIAH